MVVLKKTKSRLDQLLVKKDLVESRAKAQALIMARQVLVNGVVADKAGAVFADDVDVVIKEVMPFVSRGGLKLEKALREFDVNITDKVCLDVGASTGGFTDCLLQNGAKKVFCVDVGYGQLHWKIRNDPRVVNFERENFRHFDISKITDPIEVVVMDVSFISVKKLIPKIAEILSGLTAPRLHGPAVLVILVKPQFEAGPKNVGKGGVVRDEKVRERVLLDVTEFVLKQGFENIHITQSPITGADGNVEYLLSATWSLRANTVSVAIS
ncbi:MAG: hypothetical protein ACD_62C00176G0007 [uncultured bacterium]|nr:MAG: hypothetical protein ACD_62C00176G0007 [uncultured bacterium]HLD45816.1 TlyA family RNA methyltransferase [bacterium]